MKIREEDPNWQGTAPIRSDVIDPTSPFYIFDDNMADSIITGCINKVRNAFNGSPYIVTNIQSAISTEIRRRFYERWRVLDRLTGRNIPILAFHGTAARNIPNIKVRGLLVPGIESKDIRVAHGSAMGTGIYLARDPMIAVNYSTDNQMLACAVILGKCLVGQSRGAKTMDYHSNTNHDGSIMVISTGAQVLPLFIITFTTATTATPVTQIVIKKKSKKKKK